MTPFRRVSYLALLLAGLWLAYPAGMLSSAFSQGITFTPATTARDNIAATIENTQISPGLPDGTVSCRGNRAGQRPTLRCDVRYVNLVSVIRAEISERNNPANVWNTTFRPFTQAEDETAYLILVDRSTRANAVINARRDLAEIFRQLGPRQRVAVAAFDTKLEILQDFTQDGAAVATALDRVRAGVQTTELYRLSLEAVQRLGQFQAPRKVLIIASDGKFDDTAFRHNQVAQEANRLNIRIVTIGYYERQSDFTALQSLRRLSVDTRGFFIETPGPQRGLNVKGRADFQARLMAGVIVEAEAQARIVPAALQISLRHPQGATTSFIALLAAGVGNPDGHGLKQTPMVGEESIGERLQYLFAWFTEDLTRIAAALILVAILLLAFLVTGMVRRSSRKTRMAAAAAKQPVRPAPRIVPDDPPTIAKANPVTAAVPSYEDPPKQVRPTAFTAVTAPRAADAPPTIMRDAGPIAWLEFNGEPGTVAMKKERIAIGRERDNDVVTDAQELTVSRHHAVISVAADGSFQIVNRTKEYRDVPNPILINGVAQESGRIADGDVIKLGTGNYGFLFRDARGTTIPRRN